MPKKNGFKPKKIKESHMFLLMTLARKSLNDGYLDLTESALQIQNQIMSINDDLLPSEVKAKIFN